MKNIPVFYLPANDQHAWCPSEMTELFNTVKQLINAGYFIEACWGTSDEGDPWFAFIDGNNNVPILHILRRNNIYTAIAFAHSGSFHSRNLKKLLRATIQKFATPLLHIKTRNIQ